ncbi:hypothetical protein SERLADRAFT_432699 [Serpula lacrymans var. lacrymans S7.9]|uniref:Guanine nucleotide-binding protein-like 1 n=1 Tax=Serpula lacrymans var. lacrymans (strain S7.9) TaxID=578457 RepID=F8NG68_SERL9|nr:uncharacterized protein SERLADRAFT_432699 [Serpula lacrymans var. lacrymans S7.9]EGO31038.1 hypothetical protein SERLADRAFT_432699 [Serpula lacrymans var. lacrymans S7.9]
MPRRIPASAKQRRAKIQSKRAVKRGDAPPPEPKPRKPHQKPRRGPTGALLGPANASLKESSRKLQSAFVKLDPHFLEQTKDLAASLPLIRPIAVDACLLRSGSGDEEEDKANSLLAVPKRPKWRFDMTKKEVECNEEGWFKKWISETDDAVQQWCVRSSPKVKDVEEGPDTESDKDDMSLPEEPSSMPRAPTYFERNIEVWRQLWRVTEISQIILLLLDSRCPILHIPHSLTSYLTTRPIKLVLILTKVDIAGPKRADAWTSYLQAQYPDVPVIPVEAYAERVGAQGKSFFEPHMPLPFRERLVKTLRDAHAEMLRPPNSENVEKRKPSVKKDVDWEAVLKAEGGLTGSVVGGAAAPKQKESSEDSDNAEDKNAGHGSSDKGSQPNVGKSSLLNALFGLHKVRASRTPGKTKHFQTLFWTPDVRLVDCPGLVMPAFVPMEIQVLSGIFPISRVSAIPYCIHHISQLLPLERILQLTHPSTLSPPAPDKRTWRDGTRPERKAQEKEVIWTAMDILTAYAEKKGWVTAQAGRPDINRAGNSILRAVAEGRIKWAFWPPETSYDIVEEGSASEKNVGIWVPGGTRVEDEDEESDEYREVVEQAETEEEESLSDAEDDEEVDVAKSGAIGRFSALVDSESEEEDDEGSGKASMGRLGALALE